MRAAVAALFINVFTLATLAYFGRVGYLEISGLTSLNFDKVAVAGINFIFLNAVSAISMAGLMKGLKVTSQKERKAIEIIKQEREDLLKAKENLEEEIQIRLESEEKYRILAENVTDVIWTMDMDLNYTYINSLLRLN